MAIFVDIFMAAILLLALGWASVRASSRALPVWPS